MLIFGQSRNRENYFEWDNYFADWQILYNFIERCLGGELLCTVRIRGLNSGDHIMIIVSVQVLLSCRKHNVPSAWQVNRLSKP